MAYTLISPAEWREVRRAVEGGLSLREAAQAYGVEHEAVRKRAQREHWLTPNKIESSLKKAQSLRQSQIVPAEAVIAKTLAEKGENLRSLALKLSEKGLKQAISADLPVESWQDAKLAWEIGAKAAGLDKGEGASVTVLFGAPPEDAATPAHIQEAEVVDADDLAELE